MLANCSERTADAWRACFPTDLLPLRQSDVQLSTGGARFFSSPSFEQRHGFRGCGARVFPIEEGEAVSVYHSAAAAGFWCRQAGPAEGGGGWLRVYPVAVRRHHRPVMTSICPLL